ncbi:MAG TPA: hypothetical protein DCP37_14900 [Dehalococcoidia bacterium]|jgi:predicted small metal-binding protein|nr:DUF1059 domain-containing protein [SAR202 cluster bacterium]MDP6800104.1 DUF1059 domain-containing protein [SAR202 cluster bacterium]MQG58060.1 DUF1059 domain-containing protein [SAR202 cluster bacterium]HAL49036.1 hypothetical protein [Dehalococcoidia bacterium]|tara:strand:+ start:1705 stop:1968 length:264 start_codon:yes stop_codon:yes gene_type:complete
MVQMEHVLNGPNQYDGAVTYYPKFRRGDAMAKTYACRDVGADCDWKTSGATVDEVMATVGEHAAQVHPTIELTPELMATVRSVIKDE